MHYPDDGFIFRGEKGRTTRRQISYCIEKAYLKAGMPVKSAHDIRRTIARYYIANGVQLDDAEPTL